MPKIYICKTSVNHPHPDLMWQTYIVFQAGQVGVPAQADNVNIHDTVFGGEVVKVDHLCERPHAQVHLRGRKTKVQPAAQTRQSTLLKVSYREGSLTYTSDKL